MSFTTIQSIATTERRKEALGSSSVVTPSYSQGPGHRLGAADPQPNPKMASLGTEPDAAAGDPQPGSIHILELATNSVIAVNIEVSGAINIKPRPAASDNVPTGSSSQGDSMVSDPGTAAIIARRIDQTVVAQRVKAAGIQLGD